MGLKCPNFLVLFWVFFGNHFNLAVKVQNDPNSPQLKLFLVVFKIHVSISDQKLISVHGKICFWARGSQVQGSIIVVHHLCTWAYFFGVRMILDMRKLASTLMFCLSFFKVFKTSLVLIILLCLKAYCYIFDF